jgi:probable rRNA maturation factor
VKITVANTQRDLKIHTQRVRTTVAFLLEFLGVTCDEVSICFVSEKKLCQLHACFFNDPSPTDCITFPIDTPGTKGYSFLGEIFISPKAALLYDPKKPYDELTLYLTHGILHLIGYDDMDPKNRKKMRAMEKKCMASLKKKSLLLHPIEKNV